MMNAMHDPDKAAAAISALRTAPVHRTNPQRAAEHGRPRDLVTTLVTKSAEGVTMLSKATEAPS